LGWLNSAPSAVDVPHRLRFWFTGRPTKREKRCSSRARAARAHAAHDLFPYVHERQPPLIVAGRHKLNAMWCRLTDGEAPPEPDIMGILRAVLILAFLLTELPWV